MATNCCPLPDRQSVRGAPSVGRYTRQQPAMAHERRPPAAARMSVKSLRSLAFWLVVITCQCRTSRGSVCDSFGARYRTDVQKLLDSVFGYRKLNLVLLLDVSGSIGRALYRREVETFAIDLLEYGIRKSGLIVHPDYARIELVTFDDMARIQAYSYKAIHACEIYNRLQEITPGQFDGRTEVHVAFNTTRELFIKTQRPGDKKVLFLVTDGGFTSPPAAVRTSVGNLRAIGVEIFTVGVGTLSSSWIQRNIDSVVLDDLHILCYDTWSELVKWARDKDVQDITFANVTAAQLANSCPICLNHSSCMCAVNIQQYICRCDPGYTTEEGICQPTKVCVGDCPITTRKPPSVSEQTLIIVILLATLVLLLLTTTMMIVLMRWRRYKKRTSTAASGIHAIFNFMFFRVSNKTVFVESDRNGKCAESNVYVISGDNRNEAGTGTPRCTTDTEVQTAPSVRSQVAVYEARLAALSDIKRQRAPNTPTCESSYDAPGLRHSSASSHRYLSVDPGADRLDDDGYLVLLSCAEEVDQPSDGECYENITNMASAFADELQRLVDGSDLKGAAVFCKEDDSLATAGNIRLGPSDAGRLLLLIRSEEDPDAVKLPLAGELHEVKLRHRDVGLYAERVPGDERGAALWAVDTERHLVVGVGTRTSALACQRSVDQFAAKVADVVEADASRDQ